MILYRLVGGPSDGAEGRMTPHLVWLDAPGGYYIPMLEVDGTIWFEWREGTATPPEHWFEGRPDGYSSGYEINGERLPLFTRSYP
jgi:hypothetical protein